MTYNSLTINQKVNAKGNMRKWNGSSRSERPLIKSMINRDADLFNYKYPEYSIRFNNKEPRGL